MSHDQLTLGSLFDGSGGFPLAGMMTGIKPVWSSEIEPFPIRVTEKRLPDVKHYGDVSTLKGSELEPVDIITFGSPCQDMSIAGRREGLDGKRSGLFFEAVRIIKEMREATNGKYPEYAVWENVPGAFSSNGGEDFRAVISELVRVKKKTADVPRPAKWNQCGLILGDGFSLAWRLLDAQYWGVPQRRRRIWLVADFDHERAGEILFESEGVSGYSAQSFKAWKEAAGNTAEGAGKAEHGITSLFFENHIMDARYRGPMKVGDTVTSRYGTGGDNQPLVLEKPSYALQGSMIGRKDENGPQGSGIDQDVSFTLNTVDHHAVAFEDNSAKITKETELNRPKAYGISVYNSRAMLSDNPKTGIYEAEKARTLDENGGLPACNQGGIAVVVSENGDDAEQHALAFAGKSASLSANDGPKGPSSQQLSNPEENFVAVYHSSKSYFQTEFTDRKAVDTLVATDYKDPPTVSEEPDYIVRRLTPVECARLQGFPDWWCDGLASENPSEEEISRWDEIFETYRKAMGKENGRKSRVQIVKWLHNPYSDSAAYKMWGNGICLSNAYFVLAGIVWANEKNSSQNLQN